MVEVNGFLMDARHLPLNLQEAAYEKRLIPYVPSKKERDKTTPQFHDNIEIVYERMDPSEVPPLDEHAQAILGAMRKAGEPLSRKQLLKETGIPASAWGSSLALLMMHDLVEFGRCNKRGEVYSCKEKQGECPSNPPKPKEPRPLPPADSLPFFDMQDQIDWSDKKVEP